MIKSQPDLVKLAEMLPSHSTAFVGRQRELADIAQFLDQSKTGLLTILASGGMGKTRLALAVAKMQVQNFGDGVYFVPLVALSSPDDIVPTIAEHIGLQLSGGEAPKQQLLDYLHDRNLLLVLDNFEHLLAGAELVLDILQIAPDVKILITSREKLKLTSETVFRLSGLDFSEWVIPADALEYDAVKLFMQSAYRIRPDFELQKEDLEHLARICRLTAGMPLALVLAAGWLDVLTLKQIAAEIQQGIDILETELRDVPDRHQSVRATFNYSWNRLSADERAVFMRFSIFRGGFTGDAAQAVAKANNRHLRKLVDKALIQALPNGRYDIHELMRQFGEEKLLEAGGMARTEQAHGRYYMDFVAGLENDLKAFKVEATVKIEIEYKNIQRAWWWAVEHRHFDRLGMVAECMMKIVVRMNLKWENYHLFQATLVTLAPEPSGTPHPVWDYIALIYEWLKEDFFNERIDKQLIDAILVRSEQRNDLRQLALGSHLLAAHSYQVGNFKMALEFGQQALHLWGILDDPQLLSNLMVKIGFSHTALGQADQAQLILEEALEIRRQTGLQIAQIYSLRHLGSLHLLHGRLAQAKSYFDEMLSVQRIHGHWDDQEYILFAPTIMLLLRGQLMKGEAYVAEIKEVGRSKKRLDHKFGLEIEALLASIRGDNITINILIDSTLSGGYDQWNPWIASVMYCGLGEDNRSKQSLCDLLQGSIKMKASTLRWISLPIATILASRKGRPVRALELLSLAYTAPKELIGWLDHWQLLKEVRTDLEAQFDQNEFNRIWARGQQLDIEQVIHGLLIEFDADFRDPVEQINEGLPNPLTPKELEVLNLLAEGLTNPQIAERLFITTGTVKGHVNKILHKLEVTSRQQAASEAKTLHLLKT